MAILGVEEVTKSRLKLFSFKTVFLSFKFCNGWREGVHMTLDQAVGLDPVHRTRSRRRSSYVFNGFITSLHLPEQRG
jgi:hypothetical protein